MDPMDIHRSLQDRHRNRDRASDTLAYSQAALDRTGHWLHRLYSLEDRLETFLEIYTLVPEIRRLYEQNRTCKCIMCRSRS